SSPALAGDLAIIGSEDGFLYALSQANGRQVWRFATAKPVYATPVVTGDVVVCGSLDGSVYGLGLAQGEQRWRFETGGPVGGRARGGRVAGDRFVAKIGAGRRIVRRRRRAEVEGVMALQVILHLHNEDPFLAEVDALPAPGDNFIKVSNPRKRDGKALSTLAHGVT